MGEPRAGLLLSRQLYVNPFAVWLCTSIATVGERHPMTATKLHILHISDIHYSKERWHDIRVVVNAMLGDLRTLAQDGLSPNIIIISGDVAQDADEDGVYQAAYNDVIEPLIDLTGCHDTVFIVPGNHDAQRSAIEMHVALQNHTLDACRDRTTLNTNSRTKELNDLISSKFSRFHSFAAGIRSKWVLETNPLYESFYVKPLDLVVVAANTAALSYGGLYKTDERMLLFPEQSLYNAINDAPNASTKLFIAHHPSTWLAEFCETDIDALIERSFDYCLYGHLHNEKPICSRSINGTVFRYQAGALFTDRQRYNGYAIVSHCTETKHVRVTLRRYWDKRAKFDDATDQIEAGRYYSSPEAESYWRTFPTELNVELVRQWLTRHPAKDLKDEFDTNLSDKPLSEIFVEPPITLEADPSIMDKRASKQKTITINDILDSQVNYQIFGEREFGKTALLQQMARRCLDKACYGNSFRVPFLLRFVDIKPPIDRLMRLLREQLPGELPAGVTIEKIMTAGVATILIDDVLFGASGHCKVLREFVKRYPRPQIVLAGKRDVYEGFGVVPALDIGVPLTPLFLQQFSRHKMRELVSKWNGSHETDTNAVLDRVCNDIIYLNVPFTGVNGTIFLTILDSYAQTPINRATLIERFVEVLLRKNQAREILRETYDFKIKTDYLSRIAEHMVRRQTYALPFRDIVDITQEYFDRRGFNLKAGEWINTFVESRVLQEANDVVNFRYRAFFEYFVGLRMSADKDFRSFVLSEDNCPRYVNEIEYYSAIQREDEELIELIGRRFLELREDVFLEAGWKPDIRRLDAMAAPSSKDAKGRERLFDDVNAVLALPRLTQREKDEIRQMDIPADLGKWQDVEKPSDMDKACRLTSYLILYARVLRNLELIEYSKKKQHVRYILEAWSEYLFQSLIWVPTIAKERCVNIGGIVYRVIMPAHFSDEEVGEYLYKLMPKGFCRLLFFNMGTEKLARAIDDEFLYSSPCDEPGIVLLFRKVLYGDLKLPSFLERLEEVEEKFRHSGYLREGFLEKIKEMFLLGDWPDAVEEKFRRLIADTAAGIYPVPHRERSKRVSTEMQRLKRQETMNVLLNAKRE